MAVTSGISVYLAKKLMDHTFGATAYTAPATVYFGLFTTAPTLGAGGTECTGGSYARKSITNDTSHFADGSGSTLPITKATNASITMVTASADWSSAANVVAWGLFDASTAGNLLAYGPVGTPAPVVSGETATIASGALTFTVDGT